MHDERTALSELQLSTRFEHLVLPHLDAAYNLARWLLREPSACEDAVQEAYLRAYQSFSQFRGEDARAWLLTIVRNTCFTWLQQNRRHGAAASFDEDLHDPVVTQNNPETILLRRADVEQVRQAIAQLPLALREIIVLREIEGMAYKQIADVVGVPIGTVMSRLSRAREKLAVTLAAYEGVAP